VYIAPEIATLLHTYKVVFHTPTGFPESGIKTMPFPSTPIQSRLKEHIEKMVHEMLE